MGWALRFTRHCHKICALEPACDPGVNGVNPVLIRAWDRSFRFCRPEVVRGLSVMRQPVRSGTVNRQGTVARTSNIAPPLRPSGTSPQIQHQVQGKFLRQ